MSALDRAGLRTAVREAADQLAAAGVASPEVDARLLAEHLLGRPLLLADGSPAGFLDAYRSLVARRAAREPLQHILGRMWFRGLELVSRPGVFIVRPETEVVAGAAIEAARSVAQTGLGRTGPVSDGLGAVQGAGPGIGDVAGPGGAGGRDADVTGRGLRGAAGPLVVDLCTGSGAIAVAVAEEVPDARVLAIDLDEAAVQLAVENCWRLVPGRVEVLHADATDPVTLNALDGAVDVVVSNPPYVPVGAVEDPETKCDPELALYGGGGDGLVVPCAIVTRAARLLHDGGVLVLEHDPGQGAALREAARDAGFVHAQTGRDLTGRDRFLRAWR